MTSREFIAVALILTVCPVLGFAVGLLVRSRRRRAHRTNSQPPPLAPILTVGENFIPQVSSDDVERIIRRNFPAADYDSIWNSLRQYRDENSNDPPYRVYVAILKLSAGDPSRVPHFVTIARSDYRDVLLSAENPGFTADFVNAMKMNADDARALKRNDKRQYETWFNGAPDIGEG